MIRRILIAPRWSGRATSDFYPWLRDHLRDRVDVDALDLPDPQTPTIDAWTGGIAAALGDDDDALHGVLLVGHSVGCRALLHYLARLRPSLRPASGLLCVAGWWSVDRPWPTILPWIEAPLDLARARAAAPKVVTLLSDDDPYTSDHQANQALWEARMGATVELIAGAKHFNQSREPAVLDAILRHFVGP